MADEHMWYYMDSTGQEFGPYPSSTMKGWFQQRFFPMQGDLQVRTDEMPQGQHYSIKELYGEPIMQTAFEGPPKQMKPQRGGNAPRGPRSGGGGGGGGGRNSQQQAMSNPMDSPYDGGMGAAAALGMPWLMPGAGGMGAMPGAGANMYDAGLPFGFPGAPRPGFPSAGMGFPGFPAMPGSASGRFQGRIKSFNVQKGFGFIECPEAHQIYGRDVFLHKAQVASYQIGSQVTFAVEMNKSNMPQARDIMEADGGMGGLGYGGGMGGMGYPTAHMGGMQGGGGKGGCGNKGGGKGKSGGGGKGGNKPKGSKGGNNNNNKQGGDKKAGGGGGKGGAPAQPEALED